MARMEKRLNLRLDAELYGTYERLAAAMAKIGGPPTVTKCVRMLVELQQEQAEMLCAYAEKAAAGDREAAHEIFDKVMDWNATHVALGREEERNLVYPEPVTP